MLIRKRLWNSNARGEQNSKEIYRKISWYPEVEMHFLRSIHAYSLCLTHIHGALLKISLLDDIKQMYLGVLKVEI